MAWFVPIDAESTLELTASAGDDGDHRIEGIGIEVILDFEKLVIDPAYKRQLIEVLDVRSFRSMNEVCVVSEYEALDGMQIIVILQCGSEVPKHRDSNKGLKTDISREDSFFNNSSLELSRLHLYNYLCR